MKNSPVLIIIVAAVMGIAGFLGGMKYQQSKSPAFLRQFENGQGVRVGQGQGVRQGFRPVNGEIISADEKSITVKMPDGTSRIVLMSDKTEINKAASGTREDLKVGETVAVFGTENTDGSVTAQNIQLNTIFRGNLTPSPTP